MQHEMHLHDRHFQKTKDGTKTIELRIYDEKRQAMHPGDEVTFINRADGETILCKIRGICRFEDFKTLISFLNPRDCGWDPAFDSANADIDKDLEKYFLKSEIEKFGVVGIILEKVQ